MIFNVKQSLQVTKIDEALSEFLPEERQEARNFASDLGPDGANQVYRKCPSCHSDMVLRQKRDNTGYFISCMGYPQCKSAVWMPSTVHQLEIDTQTCSVVRCYLLMF